MHKSFKFNGIKKPWLYQLRGRSKPPYAPVQRNLLTVAGMPGAYLQSSEVQPLQISQPVGFKIKDDEHALQLKDELAEWLITDDPVELQFDDEPGRTYFAVVQNTLDDFEKIVTLRQGTIQFLCVDPYSYGTEKNYAFPTDVQIITNNGTAESDPIFELEVMEPTTFALVQNGLDEYMMIGRPYDVDSQASFVKYEEILNAPGSSLVGWTTHNSVDGGIVAGTMGTNGSRFQATDYGTGSSWHGPAIKRSLPEILTNFRLEARVGFWNGSANQVGRVEIYLLDVNGNQVAKVALKDVSSGRALAKGEARAGDVNNNHFLINEAGDKDGNWNNFDGVLRIEREGNVWTAYFAKVNPSTGKHNTRRTVTWRDSQNAFNRTVAQVVVHVGKVGSHATGAMGIYNVAMWKINKETIDMVPFIALPGDKIIFDHKDDEIYINGEPRKDLKDFGAQYFKLAKGLNPITVLPNSFKAAVKYRERYK